MRRTIILAAGGTGGHVFPAIALAHELKRRGYHPILLTDRRIQKFGAALKTIPHQLIHTGPLSLRGIPGLLLGLVESFIFFRKVKPIAVVGFGGYPSFPGVAVGLCLRLPTILHEQNSYMGKVNRLFAPYVRSVGLSFPHTNAVPEKARKKCKMVGLPVRVSIKKIRNVIYSINEDELFLLVTGGSQGTAVFSEIIPQALTKLPIFMQRKLRVTQQCRAEDVSATQDFYMRHNIKARVSAFIEDMSMELSRADMVIARAGASTCAELAVAGRPSVLVPYPHATEDHQTTNAEWLKEAGAAIVIPQDEFTFVILANLLQNLFQSPEKRFTMAEAAKDLGIPEAEGELADLLLKAL